MRHAAAHARSTASRAVIAGIEAGGTKILCAVGPEPDRITASERIPTGDPEETLSRIARFLVGQHESSPEGIQAVGIACFGPLDLRPGSPTYGSITASPKVGWRGVDMLGAVRDALPVPAAIDLDVNGAALAENRYGAGRGARFMAYVTVGTGVGTGVVMDGRPLGGESHPTMEHLPVRRHPDDDFGGVCPFHGDCLEGLASGPSLHARWGVAAEELGSKLADAVRVEAYYLAQLVVTLTYALSLSRVVLGGGVLKLPGLLEAVRQEAADLTAGARPEHPVSDPGSQYCVRPALGDFAGVTGAMAMATDLLTDPQKEPDTP